MSIPDRSRLGAALVGGVCVVATRALLSRAIVTKLRRDVERLNAGDHQPLLFAYGRDAVLRFDEGPHRWSGRHVGRTEIERFLRDFVRAGLQGRIHALWFDGPPWAMRLVVRFDDSVTDSDGETMYANRVVIIVRLRWGRIVEQEDFYMDTRRIDALEARLRERGVAPMREGPRDH